MIIKGPKPNRGNSIGGNRKPQSFKNCEECGVTFGPLHRLNQIFCSRRCSYENIKKRPKKPRMKMPTKVRSAHSLLSYHVKKGHIIKPDLCEECNQSKRLEGAHYNYDEPLKVRWLCRSCHIKWDKQEPKVSGVLINVKD